MIIIVMAIIIFIIIVIRKLFRYSVYLAEKAPVLYFGK